MDADSDLAKRQRQLGVQAARVQAFAGQFLAQVGSGWVFYTRVPETNVDDVLVAARQGAAQARMHVDIRVVEPDAEVPLPQLPDTRVIRISSTSPQ